MDEMNWQEQLPEEVTEPASEEVAEEKKEKEDWRKVVLTYLHDLSYLLASLILVFLLLFRVVIVEGTSMNNTLLDGDYLLLLSNTFYHEPQYGDVIVASKKSFDNGAPIVKRVIATEGQWVNINFETGIVYVGDTKDTMQPLDEPYTLTLTIREEGVIFPLQVDEGCLFVMGDNRDGSKDSRDPEIGLVDKREVLGKVIFLFVPGTNKGQYEQDFGRIGVVD
ncbi:MAG: signal peptidase I [Ruminococcaceae bacterium]|nr:signal peptidase I [Oscillospiraceae bacterium]